MDLSDFNNELDKLRRSQRRIKRREVFARPTRRFKERREQKFNWKNEIDSN